MPIKNTSWQFFLSIGNCCSTQPSLVTLWSPRHLGLCDLLLHFVAEVNGLLSPPLGCSLQLEKWRGKTLALRNGLMVLSGGIGTKNGKNRTTLRWSCSMNFPWPQAAKYINIFILGFLEASLEHFLGFFCVQAWAFIFICIVLFELARDSPPKKT